MTLLRSYPRLLRAIAVALPSLVLVTGAEAQSRFSTVFQPVNGVSADGTRLVTERGFTVGVRTGEIRHPGYLPGGTYLLGEKISGDGSVTVGWADSTASHDPEYTVGGNEAYRATPSGNVGLGGLGTGHDTRATGVSDDGSIVVGQTYDGNRQHAFRWTAATGMVSIGALSSPFPWSYGGGISGDGRTIVGTSFTNAGSEAFRWTASGGMVSLGDLAGGTVRSGAVDASSDGSAIVGYGTTARGIEGFRWTASGGMMGLGVLPGRERSQSGAISPDGRIVVGLSQMNDFSDSRATIWDPVNGLRDLNDVAVSAGLGSVLNDYTMTSAEDIAVRDGIMTIGGSLLSKSTGQTAGYVIQLNAVPEPATCAALGLGALALLRRRRR